LAEDRIIDQVREFILASHMGHADVAVFLVEGGMPLHVYAAASMGRAQVVHSIPPIRQSSIAAACMK
jgi:hypothetical protein